MGSLATKNSQKEIVKYHYRANHMSYIYRKNRKEKVMEKLLIFVCALCLIPGWVYAEKEAPAPVLVYVRGENVEFSEETQMVNKDDRICLPVRKISEKMDYKVEWKDKDRRVTLKNGEKEVTFTIDERVYSANGEEKSSDVAPFIVGDRTYLPMRFLGEALGEYVGWDEADRVATFGEFPRVEQLEGEKIEVSSGYGFTIPKALKDKISSENTPVGVILYENKNRESGGGGMLGNFALVDRPESETRSYLLGKVGDQYLMFYYPGDVNWDINDESLTAAYRDAEKYIPEILRTVRVTKAK